MIKQIRLSNAEFDHVKKIPQLSNELENILNHPSKVHGQDRYYAMSSEIADQLRDLCNDELIRVGFDSEYNLNDIGKILDPLIDRFFFG